MLFFGVGSGRCGTMTLANLLNAEAEVKCLHEGKFRHGETSGEQWLPFLTLQNLIAYHYPEKAADLFRDNRSVMPELQKKHKLAVFGDIAYNYAPFVKIIPEFFPEAKLIYIFRDGRDFIRSAYTNQIPDPTPIGWPDDRPLNKLEKYIALGRLRPYNSHIETSKWYSMSAVEKNAWLWSETNRLILDGLSAWPYENVLMIRFEEFFANPLKQYQHLREFLELDTLLPAEAKKILYRKINQGKKFILPPWPKWKESTRHSFWKYAENMMEKLNYDSSIPQ